MKVIKRDGSKEKFNPVKIQQAIVKAFKSTGYILTPKDMKELAKFCQDFNNRTADMAIEEIQDRVEKFMMSQPKWFNATKAFMLYREQHKQARLISEVYS